MKEFHQETQGFCIVTATLRACPVEATCWPELRAACLPYLDGSGGGSTRGYIEEWFRTGRIERLENYRNDPLLSAIRQFLSIPYVGLITARKWALAGMRSVPEAFNAIEQGRLKAPQPIALECMRASLETPAVFDPIPLDEVGPLTAAVAAAAHRVNPRYSLTQVGGGRRGARSFHDVDLLLCDWEDEEAARLSCLRRIVEELQAEQEVESVVWANQSDTERSSVDIIQKEWDHIADSENVGSENMDNSVRENLVPSSFFHFSSAFPHLRLRPSAWFSFEAARRAVSTSFSSLARSGGRSCSGGRARDNTSAF